MTDATEAGAGAEDCSVVPSDTGYTTASGANSVSYERSFSVALSNPILSFVTNSRSDRGSIRRSLAYCQASALVYASTLNSDTSVGLRHSMTCLSAESVTISFKIFSRAASLCSLQEDEAFYSSESNCTAILPSAPLARL